MGNIKYQLQFINHSIQQMRVLDIKKKYHPKMHALESVWKEYVK